jgi:phage-related minor tail protein
MKKEIETMIKDNLDGKTGRKFKSEIDRHLNQGKSKLMWLERQVAEKTTKLNSLKKKFGEYEKKAVSYTKKNPEKALAMASSAVVLVSAMWSSLRSKK